MAVLARLEELRRRGGGEGPEPAPHTGAQPSFPDGH